MRHNTAAHDTLENFDAYLPWLKQSLILLCMTRADMAPLCKLLKANHSAQHFWLLVAGVSEARGG